MEHFHDYILDKDIKEGDNSAIHRGNFMAEYLFNEVQFHDPDAAREHLESIRWPDGPYCPICGSFDSVKRTTISGWAVIPLSSMP